MTTTTLTTTSPPAEPDHPTNPADADPGTWRPPHDAPCATAGTLGVDWFTDRSAPGYDAGRSATAVCAICPMWEPCATAAVARHELHGVWGGAGGTRLRALRRQWGTDRWPDALAAHGRRLHGLPALDGDHELLAAHGGSAECGKRSTWAKGHTCDACSLSAGLEGALASTGRRRSLAAAAAVWAGEAA